MTSTTNIPQQRTTRRPTGIPSWPVMLLAGSGKSGKSWACAEASGSELVGRTFWVGLGEKDPDEYGAVKGADFEIVPHDGSFRDILAAIDWCVAQPDVDGKPSLLIVDSATILWELLCGMAQDAANTRARNKASRANRAVDNDVEADITMDLWNQAKDRWGHFLESIRSHRGPVIVTARLDEVTVMVNGRPSQERTLKVKAEKSLPYDVDAIVQLPERGKAYLTGVRSVRLQVPDRIPLPGFTVDKLWRQLGLDERVDRDRQHSGVTRSDPVVAQRALLFGEIRNAVNGDDARVREIAQDWARNHDGQPITETTDIGGLKLLVDDLKAEGARKAAAAEVPA
jgi:AAA domain-containing protein